MATTGPQFRMSGNQTARQRAAEQPIPISPAPPVNATPAQVEQVLSTPLTAGYRPNLPIYSFRDEYFDPVTFYFDLEAMLRHDSILVPLANVKSPVAQMQISVDASSSRVARFIIAEWDRFKQVWLPAVQESAYPYGWMGAECIYGIEGGLQILRDFNDFSPRDVQPLVRNNTVVGVRNMPLSVDLSGSEKGFPAKGFWYAHRPRFGMHYGQSQIAAAWKPWRRLTGRDGIEEISDIATYRYGTGTVVVGAPLEDTKATNQAPGVTRQSSMQRAQELAENLKAGGAVVMPTTVDASGNKKWTLDFEQPQTNLTDLIEADKHLTEKCSKAIGWPPELTEAAETGSGFSGRMIPLQAFLMGQQTTAQGLFHAWFRQIGQPLMWWNFGSHAWARPKVIPLLQSYQKAASGGKDGGASQDKLPKMPKMPPQMQPPGTDEQGQGQEQPQPSSPPFPDAILSTSTSEAYTLAMRAVEDGIAGSDPERALKRLAKALPLLDEGEFDIVMAALEADQMIQETNE